MNKIKLYKKEIFPKKIPSQDTIANLVSQPEILIKIRKSKGSKGMKEGRKEKRKEGMNHIF